MKSYHITITTKSGVFSEVHEGYSISHAIAEAVRGRNAVKVEAILQ